MPGWTRSRSRSVAGTISYNILCSISARVRRVYV